jgi:hypothetical protein
MERRSALSTLLAFLGGFKSVIAQQQTIARPDAGRIFEKNSIKEMMNEEGITDDQIVKPSLDLAKLPFQYIKSTGVGALGQFEELKRDTSIAPVIVGSDDDLARILEDFHAQTETTESYLKKADQLGLAFSISDYQKSRREDGDVDEEYEEFLKELKSDWPSTGFSLNSPTIVTDVFDGKPLPVVWLLLIPSKASANIPAFLKWGDWNECPQAHVHVAMLRKWQREYGAELVGITDDVLNIRVARRPTSKKEAIVLAEEMFHYAPDVVVQGTESISALAASLMRSDYWYFWWD